MNSTPILFLVVGFLGLVAIAVIIQVVLSSQKDKLTISSMFQGVVTLLWVLPLAGVLAYFGLKVAPGFEQSSPPKQVESLVYLYENEQEFEDNTASARYGKNVEDWVKKSVKKTENGYLVVVSGGAEDKIKKARENVFVEAVKQIEAYYAIDKQHYGPSGITKSDVKNLRIQECIETTQEGNPGFEYDMHRVHWQLAFTPELSESFVTRAKTNVSTSRIWTLGSVLAVCTFLLFGLSSYLRLDTQTEGRYRNRLKFAAISFMAVGCLAIAEFFRLG